MKDPAPPLLQYKLVNESLCWQCRISEQEMLRRIYTEQHLELCETHHLEMLEAAINDELHRRNLDGFPAIKLFCADLLIELATFRARRDQKLCGPGTAVGLLEMIMEDIREKILEEAWDALPDDQRKALVEDIAKAIARQAGRGTVESHVKELFSQHIDDLIAAELDKRESDVVARVKAELKKRWDELVNAVVTRRLQEAVQKIYTEVVRGK